MQRSLHQMMGSLAMEIDPHVLLEALGGKDNVKSVEPCITRLRVEVIDPIDVDEDGLRASGAYGVVVQNGAVQIIVGPVADELADKLAENGVPIATHGR